MQEDLKAFKEPQKTLALTISWPSPQDYNEALQNPAYSFSDPVLAIGQAELDNLGLPRPRTGMFASVYKVQSGNVEWAVRCFLRSKPDQVIRYVQIKETLQRAALSCIVPFDLQEEGIRVAGRRLPMLKMQWCHGDPLNYWLGKNLRNKQVIEDFLENWRQTLLTLSAAGVAHGDLQHGNVLIQDGQIKLVDYDGVYVPQFKGMEATELGHRSYQHPQRNESHFGPYLDNFSAWLIYLSVLISGCDRHVWQDFEGGDECLLFRRQDLDSPSESELFHVLEHHHNPQIRECSRTLRYLLRLAPEDVPGLEAPVVIPEDLPDLDSIISDLPDWIATDFASGAMSQELATAPEGKRFIKRRRHRGVALPSKPGEQTGSGRWVYDQNGLSFSPDQGADLHNKASGAGIGNNSMPAATLHSPLLDSYTSSPAPYRNIGGKLHSPIFEDDALNRDLPGQLSTQDRDDRILIVKKMTGYSLGLCTFFFGISFFLSFSHSAKQLWPEGQYYRLLDGRIAMEAGDNDKAEQSFRKGISELEKMSDSRAPVDLAYIHDNLGKIHTVEGEYETANQDFKQSLKEWQRYSGNKSIDYADVLLESAQTLASLEQLGQAEQAYQQALQIFQLNGLTAEDDSMKVAIEEYVAVLRNDHKSKEAAAEAALLPMESQPDPDNNSVINSSAKLTPAKQKNLSKQQAQKVIED